MNGGEVFFVDTNVLLYAADPSESIKHMAAQGWMYGLWETGRGRLSWQVLNEFYSAATRKRGLTAEQVRSVIVPLTAWQPVDLSLKLLMRAWYWTDTAQLSDWDALIVAAAELSGCNWLLTEDLQDGRTLGSVTILNPFRSLPRAYGLPAAAPIR